MTRSFAQNINKNKIFGAVRDRTWGANCVASTSGTKRYSYGGGRMEFVLLSSGSESFDVQFFNVARNSLQVFCIFCL